MQLQKNTLPIHIAEPTRSSASLLPPMIPAAPPPNGLKPVVPLWCAKRECVGAGTHDGLSRRTPATPSRPLKAESEKPAGVRSSRYQRKGFTRVRVRESWRGEDQGVFL